MHSFQNKTEKSYTQEKIKQIPSGYSLFTNCSLDETKNKLNCSMERFCKGLRYHAMKIIKFKRKKMVH